MTKTLKTVRLNQSEIEKLNRIGAILNQTASDAIRLCILYTDIEKLVRSLEIEIRRKEGQLDIQDMLIKKLDQKQNLTL